ncbi:MAG: lysylphosphatidylglycerol synthase transmembrane domain-containing protein [Ignavibacteriales bacterium]|nr:lysylphosphatidylglycerol synthase transmembrane domain-containing protein [Ignavibacteriales bacterium]
METRGAIMKEKDDRTKRRKSIIKLLLQGLFALVLLVVLFQFVSFADVTQALLAAKPEYIVGAALLMFVNIGLQIVKWRYFVRLVDPTATNLETAASLLFGITLGTITPGQIGEFGGRALHHTSISAGTLIGLTLVDKVQMMCIMGISGVASFVILFQCGPIVGTTSIVVFAFLFLFIFFKLNALQRVTLRFKFGFFERRSIQDLLSAVSMFQLRDLIASFGLSVGFYMIIYLQMFLLLNAFSPVHAADAYLGFAAMMFLKSLVPVSLGDLGIREASSVYFYALRGIANATALNASLLLFVINILLPSLIGLIFIPRSRSNG